MADYAQPDVVNKRVRFFDGQFLQDQDFIDEQKYHLDRERRQSQLLGVTGIVSGLMVINGGEYQVTVANGVAVDALGRHLVLTSEMDLRLSDKFAGKKDIALHLVYQATPSDLAQTGGEGARRWDESPKIVAVAPDGTVAVAPDGASSTWDGPTVLLAQLAVAAKGEVTVDATAAHKSGLSVPGAVGIGAISPPGAKLHIVHTNQSASGNALVLGLMTESNLRLGYHQNYSWVQSHGNKPLALNPIGNGVAIGADDPQGNRLYVSGGTLRVSGGPITPSSGKEENAGILFPKDPGGGTEDAAWIRYYARSGESTTLEIGTANDPDDHIALMPLTGNVGVNTIAPQGRLHVVHANQNANGNTLVLGPTTQSHLRLGYHANYSWVQTHGDKPLALNPLGNGVAIGSEDPQGNRLYVSGGALRVVGGPITPSAGKEENAGILFPKDPGGGSGDAAWIRYYARSGESTTLEIGTANDPDDHIALMPTAGNVGVNTTTPQGRLHVVHTNQDANGNAVVLGLTTGSHLRLGYHQNYSWVQSYGNKPLALNPIGNDVAIGSDDPQGNRLYVAGVAKLLGLKINSNYQFSKVQAGKTDIGPGGTGVKKTEVSFAEKFDTSPQVLVTMRNEGDYPDTFTVTVTKIAPDSFKVNIWRVDAVNVGWSQNLRMDWIAWA